MAKRRIISEDSIWDKAINKLSVEAQALWWRFLARTDDYGILPGDPEQLLSFLNVPDRLKKNIERYVDEYVRVGIIRRLEYDDKLFLVFKPKSFKHHQSFINNKRTRSEHLRLKEKDVLPILEDLEHFWESPESAESPEEKTNTEKVPQAQYKVESRKKKVESRGSAEGELPDFLEEMPTELKADSNLVQAWREFLHMRAFTRKNGKKPVRSLHAANALFKSLLKIRDPVSRVECVNLSTGEEWLSFIPEKFEKPNGQFVNAGNIKPKSSYEARLTFDPSSEEARRNTDRLTAELTIAEREQRGSDQ